MSRPIGVTAARVSENRRAIAASSNKSLRRQYFAGLDARDLDAEARFVGLAQRKGAGRNIERREAEQSARLARLHALHRDENIGAARLQQPILGDRARRHQAHDVAAHDRFIPPLFRLGRVLKLLADRDAMAERDQPLQIIVGALDRHAAHADVFAFVLAPLGQHDAERPAGDFGVLERTIRRNRPSDRTAGNRDWRP